MTMTSTPVSSVPAIDPVLSRALNATRRRRRIVHWGAVVLVGALFLARVLLGDYRVSIMDAVRILGGEQIPVASFILMESSLPRACLAVVAGAVLGMCGAATQALLRNPLASPDFVGISAGASAAAVAAITVLALPDHLVPVAALLGSATVATVLVLGTGSAGSSSRLVVLGVCLSACLVALIHAMLVRTDVYRAHDAVTWLAGSLARGTWPLIGQLSLTAAIAAPFLASRERAVHMLSLGDDAAAGLGVSPHRERRLVLGTVVVLVSAVTAVCGPIAFVALLAGPLARAVEASSTALGTAALFGAAMVLAADYAAAFLLPSGNVPVGVVTGLVGAIALLALVTRDAHRTREVAS